MNKKILILLLLLLASIQLNASMQYGNFSASVEHLETLYLNGEWDEAINMARRIMKDAPQEHPASSRARDVVMLSVDKKNKQAMEVEKSLKQQEMLEKAKEMVKQADEYILNNNYSQAVKLLVTATKVYKTDAEAFYLLGLGFLKTDRSQEAFRALQKCLELDGQHERALFLISSLSLKSAKDSEAEHYLSKLIELIDLRVAALRQDYQSYRNQQLNDQAAALTRELQQHRQNLAQATFLYGVLCEKRGDYEKASGALSRATKLNPSSADAWFYYGRVLFAKEHLHQATTALGEAINIKEIELRKHKNKVLDLLAEGKADEAVKEEKDKRLLEKEMASIVYVLALANNRKSETGVAISNLNMVLELDPSFLKARYARAILYAEKNRFEESLTEVRTVLKESTPGSEQAKKAIETIKFLMGQIAKRDNPELVAASIAREMESVEVDDYLKNREDFGGRAREREIESLLPLLQEVSSLMRMRNYPEAVRRLLYLRTKHPQIVDIHSILGYAYLKMGRLIDAEDSFEQALKVDPMHADSQNNLAYLLATRGENLNRALELSKNALKTNNTRPEFQHTMGWVLFKMGEVKESLRFFTAAIELKPDFLNAHYNRGLALYIAQDVKGAIQSFDRVIAMDFQHHKAHLFKAIALAKTGEAIQAIDTLNKLSSIVDQENVLHKVVADLKTKMQIAYESSQPLPVPEIVSPAKIEPILAEAAEYKRQGLLNKAKEKYLECQRLAPERYEPYYEMGKMQVESGLNSVALETLKKAIEIMPQHYQLRLDNAKILHKLGKYEEAGEHFSQALKINPQDAEARYYLGLIAYQDKTYESAESYALAALRQNKSFFKAMALLGMSRVRLGKLRQARDIYEELYAKAPADSSIRRHARLQIAEVTRLMAPSRGPSIENVTEIKDQMMAKMLGDDEKIVSADEQEAFERYGKNTMTLDDKNWVLRTFENLGSVPSHGPKIIMSDQALLKSKGESEWQQKRIMSLSPSSDKFSLESASNRFSIKATELPYERLTDSADPIVLAAMEFADRGFMSKAIEKLEEAQKISETNLDVLLNIGYMQTLSGNFRNAFDAYAKAVKCYPNNPLAKLGLANLYWLGGQAHEAVALWKEMKGEINLNKEYNFLARSKEIWHRMLEVDPLDIDAHSNLGLVYLFSGEFFKALVEFQAVLKLEENRPEHEFYQAQAYAILYVQTQNLNHKAEAERILKSLRDKEKPFPYSERLSAFVSKF